MGDLSILASCFVPVPALSNANRSHVHWRNQKQLADTQKEHTFACLREQISADKRKEIAVTLDCLVRLIVVSAHAMDDDNLTGSVKHYRDEVSRWLGVPDNDPRVHYVAKWERYRGKGKRGVRIEFVRFLDHLLAEKAEIERQIAALRSST